MSTTRTSVKALALIAGSVLALTACASGSSSTGPSATDSVTTAPITFTWGYEQEFSSYNNNTADTGAAANTVVMNQVQRGFANFAPDGKVVPDTEYGTFEKTADDPLTVKYTFADKAAWSDGNPLDCDDAVMAWLSRANVSTDKGWSAISTTGYEDMNKPACKDGEKTFTVTYKKKYADWQASFFNQDILPAHLVEKGSSVADLIAAADAPTGADSLKAAAYYNTAWKLNPGELKPEIMPSAGPYTISKWDAGQSITLTANDKWWGTPPKAQTIVIRFLAGDAMVQALQNGEIDAMNPQPQVELVNQLKAAGDKVKFSTADQYTFEHFDFNFKGTFADKNLREAFAKCIPRQQIVDNLIKPQNADAKILQSRFVFPFNAPYSDFEASVGGEKYSTVDVAGAKTLVDASGVKAPIQVRIGWRKDPAALNKRRVDTVALVQASCKGAGFNVVDAGTPDFFDKGLPDGNFDVALFAWTGSPLVAANKSIYTTGGGQNNYEYSNKAVDADLDSLAQEIDTDKQLVLLKKLDTALWTDLATIPLFAFPGILGTEPNVQGVEFNSTQQDLTWNAYEWSKAG